jgi:hypothetical protein
VAPRELENVPDMQFRQNEELGAPDVVEYWPALQLVQVRLDAAWMAVEKDPA